MTVIDELRIPDGFGQTVVNCNPAWIPATSERFEDYEWGCLCKGESGRTYLVGDEAYVAIGGAADPYIDDRIVEYMHLLHYVQHPKKELQ